MFDPTGHDAPVLFGYPENTFPTQLNKMIVGENACWLVPLAYEAVLGPTGAVLTADQKQFGTLEDWIETIRPEDRTVAVDVIERPWGISEVAAQVRPRLYSGIPF